MTSPFKENRAAMQQTAAPRGLLTVRHTNERFGGHPNTCPIHSINRPLRRGTGTETRRLLLSRLRKGGFEIPPWGPPPFFWKAAGPGPATYRDATLAKANARGNCANRGIIPDSAGPRRVSEAPFNEPPSKGPAPESWAGRRPQTGGCSTQLKAHGPFPNRDAAVAASLRPKGSFGYGNIAPDLSAL